MMQHDTANESTSLRQQRRSLIAKRVREHRLRRDEKKRLAFTARQLRIETEARLELMRIELKMRKFEHTTPPWQMTSDSLLSTILCTRERLTRYANRAQCKALSMREYLHYLEDQNDVLCRALANAGT